MAIQAEGKSFSALERETEQTRADLIHTVDELHSRVSPEAIKKEVKAYARDTSNELIHSLERKARENPLQTVAIAAGLACPVWRLLINIPAPVLLVGAGLAYSRFGGSSRTTHDANARSAGTHGQGEQFADNLKRTTQDASSKLSRATEGLKERVTDAAEQAKAGVSARLGAVRSRAGAAINETTEAARVAASDTVTAASEAVSSTYRSGIDAASRTGDQISESFRQSTASIVETMERHPLVVGGIGLFIGAVIASALPVSPVENRVFGEASDDLKNRARDMASERLEDAKTAAQEIFRESVSRAKEEGLNPEVVRQTVKGAGERVKNVLQQAVDTSDEDKGGLPAASAVRSL